MKTRTAETYDLVIVGLGSGGATACEFATRIGARTLVVERDRIGGDCLWTGCVPSKAAVAAAKTAHHLRTADRFGLPVSHEPIDRRAVWARIHSVRENIAATDDNTERFTALGAEVAFGAARLVAANKVAIGDRVVTSRFVLLCTGSRPSLPELAGLAATQPLTSETVWDIDQPPDQLLILGGGPIAVELAQSTCRLGVDVTVLQRAERLLMREEPTLVERLTRLLQAEGVRVATNVDVRRVDRTATGVTVHGLEGGTPHGWEADSILVATGRTPNTEGLGLEAVGAVINAGGVVVDNRMRTNLPWLYAAGDVAGRNLFTHAAGYEAVRAVRDMFYPGRGTADGLIPWCTFTDPELAHAGMTEREAMTAYNTHVRLWDWDLDHSDRARTDATTEGLIRIVTGPKNVIVGAHILAPSAGEMIHELALAIQHRMPLGDVAKLVHVYPTFSTAVGQLAAESAYETATKYRWITRLAKR